jgi:hypothetical protein
MSRAAAVDVGHGILRGQELGLLDAEDLGEQLDEGVLGLGGLRGAGIDTGSTTFVINLLQSRRLSVRTGLSRG